MKLTATVDAKVETATLDGAIQYMLHVRLANENESLASPEGGIRAAVKVDEEEFGKTTVGQEILFEEVARV